MVSPPLGKCGQPPAVVVQRLAADGGVIGIASFDTLRKVVVALRGAFFVDVARQKHVVGANSVRPWAFGQCAAMARRWMQRKVGGRTMFAPTYSTA